MNDFLLLTSTIFLTLLLSGCGGKSNSDKKNGINKVNILEETIGETFSSSCEKNSEAGQPLKSGQNIL